MDKDGNENEFISKEKRSILCNKPAVRQTFVISGIMSLIFSTGIGMGTATVMLPQLKYEEGFLFVDEAMSSWIYSIHGFGSVPAALTVPYLSKWKGYKRVFLIICLPMLFAFILQYFASNAVHLLIVGLFQGLTQGGTITLGIIAITEYAEPRLRGLFLVMKSASYFWGIWIANMIGTFANWRYIPLFGLCPLVFSLISCFLWPEGPYWLASVGRIEECKRSFHWLRGPGNGSEELSCLMKRQLAKPNSWKKTNIISTIKKVVVLRQFYMPLIINCVLLTLYQATGKIVVTVYALVIIKEVTKNENTAYIGMLIIDGVTVFGMYVGSFIAIKVRRRSMYLYTAGCTIVFLYVVSAYLFLIQYEIIYQNSFVTLSLLILYSFCVSWGPMVLSTSFLSEISPMRFKPFIVSVGSVLFWSLQLVSIKLAPLLFKNIGMHSVFGIYGTLTLFCWIFLYFYLPETNNKTLEDLETIFTKRNCNEDSNHEYNEDKVMLKKKRIINN